MADGPSIDQLNFARGIGQGGAGAGGGDEDAAKILGYLTGIKSSKGTGYYDTQGLQDKQIKPGSGGVSFLFGRMIEAMKKYVTREGTPVHAGEKGPEVASAGPIEGERIEAASQGVDFAAILGNSAGNFGNYAYNDMATGTTVAPNVGGRGGGFELG